MANYHELASYMILFGNRYQALQTCTTRYIVGTLEYFPNTSRLPHRCILSNIWLTEKYLEEELTYFSFINDYDQIQSIMHCIKGYRYGLPDNLDIYGDLTPEELKQISDCCSCILLDSSDNMFKSAINDNLERIITDISSIVKYKLLSPMPVELLEAYLHKTATILSRMICNYDKDFSKDGDLFDTMVEYIAGYLWLISLKRTIRDLAKTYDDYDYLLYVHTMFQINRWNYNREGKGDING